MIVSIRQAGRLEDGKDDQSQEFPTKTQHVWTAAWIPDSKDPKLPAISTRFLNNTKYLSKRDG
jgi:hypothetical protein